MTVPFAILPTTNTKPSMRRDEWTDRNGNRIRLDCHGETVTVETRVHNSAQEWETSFPLDLDVATALHQRLGVILEAARRWNEPESEGA